MTKVEMFNALKEVEEVKANAEMVEFIDHEIALLTKKRASKTPTKTQKENVAILENIKAILEANSGLTVTEIATVLATDAQTYSNQKVSALLKKLVDNGEVVKEYDKRVAKFSLAK